MSHKQFLCAHEISSVGYLISTRKALGMLLAHKIRDARFQLLLQRLIFILFSVLGVCICGFYFLPMFLAAGLFLPKAFACLRYPFGWEQATFCLNSPWKIGDSSNW